MGWNVRVGCVCVWGGDLHSPDLMLRGLWKIIPFEVGHLELVLQKGPALLGIHAKLKAGLSFRLCDAKGT